MPPEIEAADRDRARQLTDEIKTTLTAAWGLIVEAYEMRAWIALGYESWDRYCAEEFDSAQRLRLPREERSGIVTLMRDAGMSLRAIEAATGVSRETVRRDLSGDTVVSPGRGTADPDVLPICGTAGDHEAPTKSTAITGLDGKTYRQESRNAKQTKTAEASRMRKETLRKKEEAERLVGQKAGGFAAKLQSGENLPGEVDKYGRYLRVTVSDAAEACRAAAKAYEELLAAARNVDAVADAEDSFVSTLSGEFTLLKAKGSALHWHAEEFIETAADLAHVLRAGDFPHFGD
ncbi:hypothetical protein ACPCBX_26985 [Streptomyces tuirus]|uniref:Uncharacterized protein n=1 Tax=Streptomyces tuirus TaxID=68278 RepID=A0A7G1NJN8_9ACTN|nr:hypothetical protein [Streptomyces tuirus]BCL23463.1 hypothetical protein GCM10017668_53060 [Streptomyces tuirus]